MDRDPPPPDDKGRVLSFRPRGLISLPSPPQTWQGTSSSRSPVEDVGKYERAGPEQDDYRHRMMVNLAALAVCGLLIVVGVWIANTIAELRRDQDCVLAGRRNCAQISIIGTAGQ